jgi:hypothetical protein
MSEIAEQIQNSILTEPPATEVPAPSLPEVPPQAPAPDVPQPDGASPDEANLNAEITELWRLHTDYKGSIKNQTENLRSLRTELGKLLHQMKALLAKPGRGGQWSAWLKERQISRATADRLVTKYERSLNPELNCLNEAIPEPTEEQIQMLLNNVAPKLRRVLRTPASAYRFIDLLTSSFALDRKDTEEGFILQKPAQQTAVGEPVLEAQGEAVEPTAEPVPVIADVQTEVDSESMGTSAAL